MPDVIIPLDFAPGIQRDGTALDAQRALDALWCRWRLGRPRKMGGFSRITNTLKGIPRTIHAFYSGSQIYLHVGTTVGIQQVVIDIYGNVVSTADRTPVGMSFNGQATDWTLDAMFDTTTSQVKLIAHASSNAGSIAASAQTTPLLGQLTASSALALFSDPGSYGGGTWTLPSVAGGIVCVQPFVFDFDINGFVQWSGPNQPLTLGITGGGSGGSTATGAGQARISAQKIVAGAPIRGGGTNQPAALFWSLSEVITCVYVGSSAGYVAFSTLSDSSSVLSGKTIVEHDAMYYWVGRDRFLMYNGTVQEIPNTQNQDWFFNNLTPGYEGKAYGMKMPLYGEIWFCAPMFGNTEPSHAVILNIRDQCWYDTVLPNGGRSAGRSAQGLAFPIMGGSVPDNTGYKLWRHEVGTDQVEVATNTAVRSYFETPWIGAQKSQPPVDKGLSIQQLEPDFVQTGDLSVSVIGTSNARAPISVSAPVPLRYVPQVPQEQFVSFKESHRMLRLHIESNVLGGNYIAGKNLLHVMPAEGRLVS